MKNLDILKNFIENNLHINVDDETLNKFNIYYDLLLEWNEKFNLTTILEENDVLYKHFIDSLYVMNYVDFSHKHLLDIGSGAGFPALPLAILNKQLKIDLYESNAKKVSFLNEVKNKLSLDNVSIFNDIVSRGIKYYATVYSITGGSSGYSYGVTINLQK